MHTQHVYNSANVCFACAHHSPTTIVTVSTMLDSLLLLRSSFVSVDNAGSVGSTMYVKLLCDMSMLSMLVSDDDHDEGKGETNEFDARLSVVNAAQLSSVGSAPVKRFNDTILKHTPTNHGVLQVKNTLTRCMLVRSNCSSLSR